jgi:hypothetical protein
MTPGIKKILVLTEMNSKTSENPLALDMKIMLLTLPTLYLLFQLLKTPFPHVQQNPLSSNILCMKKSSA